jgi:hypothetical protein
MIQSCVFFPTATVTLLEKFLDLGLLITLKTDGRGRPARRGEIS